jgi:hypothetical protein
VRQVLLSKLELWKSPKLFTLTVDRERFGQDPRAAFLHITRGKFVARLMRHLGITRWLWVLEFQTRTGDGWPHWHLMIDVGDLRRRRVDLARAWALWRKKWNLGGLDLAKKETRIKTPEHAVFYITKYLTKMPSGGFPLWLLETSGVRFTQGSKAVGRLVFKSKRCQPRQDGKGERADRKSFIERGSRCRLSSIIWQQQVDHGTGEDRLAFLGKLPVPPAQLVALSEEGLISARVIVGVKNDRPAVVWISGHVDQVRRELKELGALAWVEQEAVDRRGRIMAENVFAARTNCVDRG